jgi:hypothetical protein
VCVYVHHIQYTLYIVICLLNDCTKQHGLRGIPQNVQSNTVSEAHRKLYKATRSQKHTANCTKQHGLRGIPQTVQSNTVSEAYCKLYKATRSQRHTANCTKQHGLRGIPQTVQNNAVSEAHRKLRSASTLHFLCAAMLLK